MLCLVASQQERLHLLCQFWHILLPNCIYLVVNFPQPQNLIVFVGLIIFLWVFSKQWHIAEAPNSWFVRVFIISRLAVYADMWVVMADSAAWVGSVQCSDQMGATLSFPQTARCLNSSFSGCYEGLPVKFLRLAFIAAYQLNWF